MRESAAFFEKASELMNGDFHSPGMLMACYKGTAEHDLRRGAAERALRRAEAALAKDPANGVALAFGAAALFTFGEKERAKEWTERALLLDPENVSTLYNLACSCAVEATDVDGTLDLLEKFFEKLNSPTILKHLQADPDLDLVRDHPRFREMLAAAKKRLHTAAK